VDDLPYNYVPTEWVCIVFVVLFSLLTTIHAVQAFRFRIWWLFPTVVVCGITETIGWSGRLWSSKSPNLRTPFLMQISTTIMAPTFLIAANFIILGRITNRLGPQFCRLSAVQYATFFLSCDTVALIVQAVGGGIASGTQPVLGGHIMLGGIAIQLLVLILYATLAAEFLFRFTLDRPVRRIRENNITLPPGTMDRPITLMLIGLSAMLVLLITRSVYRLIELSDGWTGTVISTQWLFGMFDGAMVVLSMFALNLFHPGVLLPRPDRLEADLDDVKDPATQSP